MTHTPECVYAARWLSQHRCNRYIILFVQDLTVLSHIYALFPNSEVNSKPP